MATKKTTTAVVTLNNGRVAEQLRDLAEKVQSGEIGGYQFSQTANSITLTVDSADGNERLIKHRDARPGLVRTTTERIQKQAPAKRRIVVKELAQEGRTQQEIAARTMRSQKTISNDLAKLKKDGEL
ncbi:HTH domain-containing protein [Delftia sp. RIT313]|uniref:HTH domain-containing protein n=1 Tax=Delftia sp. RIT313 TaxID=1468410 RepID=UPI0012681F72|nr:HTH domain-containing protein [Delftia sp. RIT313]